MADLTFLRGRRVALLTNIPRPYREPLYETLHHKVVEQGGEFKVFFFSDLHSHLRRANSQIIQIRYPHEFVTGWQVRLGHERVVSFPGRLWSSLRNYQPSVVICGGFGPPGYLAWLYTHMTHIPYIQWSGATLSRSRADGLVTQITQRTLARRADYCLTYGSVASNYLEAIGVPRLKIVTGVNAVDITFFQREAALRRDAAKELAKKQNFHRPNLLYVGNLLPLKGVELVIEALYLLDQANIGFDFHLVGAGPSEADLRGQVDRLNLSDKVHFWGAQRPEDVPLYYAMADVFIFPSLYDVWGLVLNEAMACGLPVVSSTLAGATIDLVQDGINGFALDPRNTVMLVDVLKRLIADPGLRQRMGEQARRTIEQKATIEHSAQAFIRAIEFALNPPTI